MDMKLERSAYRHCKKEFMPRGQRRFRSEACKQAAAYRLSRTAKGPRAAAAGTVRYGPAGAGSGLANESASVSTRIDTASCLALMSSRV